MVPWFVRDPFLDRTEPPAAKGAAIVRASALTTLQHYWLIILCVAAFLTPALAAMIRESWSTEQGSQGPLVLASGLWLLYHQGAGVTRGRGRHGIAVLAMALALPIAIFGRITGSLWIDWTASYAAVVAVFYTIMGGQALRRLWFPLIYLLFLVPIPFVIVGPLTHARKLWLSSTAVDLLSWAGYDVAYGGTTLYIDQYELLIADACAGINSLFSLVAIGSLYIYIRHRDRLVPALVLGSLLVPMAIFTNLIRVILLMLVTHAAGDAVAQGPFHQTIGLVMFAVMLCCLVLADALTMVVHSRPVQP